MRWWERVAEGASKAARRIGEEAERGARYLSEHGPGFVGEGAAELLAERDYHRARELLADGWSEAVAREVASLLAPYGRTECHQAVLISRMLGRAHRLLREPEPAREHYQRALHLIRDPAERMASEGRLVEEEGLVADELEAEVLLALCALVLEAGELDQCVRYAMQAVELDRHNVEGYYYQAAAMLRRGISSDSAAELLMKALMEGNDSARVLAWVEELMPEHLPWFRRIEE